jgi:UV excision repair protein RAD23
VLHSTILIEQSNISQRYFLFSFFCSPPKGIPNVPEAPPTASSPTAERTQSPTLSPTTPLVPPQFLQQQQQQQQQSSPQQSGSGVFDFLRQHPQFNTLRMMVQQNPDLLQPVLQQLGQANPSILQLINQHQQEFIQLLNEPVQPGTGSVPQTGTGTPPGGPQYIQVTQEEKAAIDRVCEFCMI